jgi:hypothetical protein
MSNSLKSAVDACNLPENYMHAEVKEYQSVTLMADTPTSGVKRPREPLSESVERNIIDLTAEEAPARGSDKKKARIGEFGGNAMPHGSSTLVYVDRAMQVQKLRAFLQKAVQN